MEDKHIFWKSEPVGLGDENMQISPRIRTEAVQPPLGYRFSVLDTCTELRALHKLIKHHYVSSKEDDVVLTYTEDFLKWQLECPLHKQEYACTLKFAADADTPEEMVGFVLAKEQHISVRGAVLRLVGINYLCLHADHRSLGLAPLLIREITLRAHTERITMAIFTGGSPFFFSFARVQYFHRPINVEKLVEMNFVPAYMCRHGRFHVSTPRRRIRPMQAADVDEMMLLYRKECQNYELFEVFNREAFLHALLPRDGVVHTYVVGDKVPEEFVSFFIANAHYPKTDMCIRTAYLYYYATPNVEGLVEDSMDALRTLGVDLLNVLALGRSREVVANAAYIGGTGWLSYSFYNFRTSTISPEKLFFVMH